MTQHRMVFVFAFALLGCKNDSPSTPPTTGGQRASLTAEACANQGGEVVGDIGDGATQRPDYVCSSGATPLGDIAPPKDGPIGTEGAVCCPTAEPSVDEAEQGGW